MRFFKGLFSNRFKALIMIVIAVAIQYLIGKMFASSFDAAVATSPISDAQIAEIVKDTHAKVGAIVMMILPIWICIGLGLYVHVLSKRWNNIKMLSLPRKILGPIAFMFLWPAWVVVRAKQFSRGYL